MVDSQFLVGHSIYLSVPNIESLDIQEWSSWYNDQKLTEFNTHGVFPVSTTQEREYILTAATDPNTILLAIMDKEGDSLIGNIALKDINVFERHAEIALTVRRAAPPSASIESMGLMISHGFRRLNLNRIYGGTDENLKHWVDMLGILGITIEGREREAFFRDNQFRDNILFSIIRSDYDDILRQREGKFLFGSRSQLFDEMKTRAKSSF
jgi:RimJ/RimL family protein N-acetyltransferase